MIRKAFSEFKAAKAENKADVNGKKVSTNKQKMTLAKKVSVGLLKAGAGAAYVTAGSLIFAGLSTVASVVAPIAGTVSAAMAFGDMVKDSREANKFNHIAKELQHLPDRAEDSQPSPNLDREVTQQAFDHVENGVSGDQQVSMIKRASLKLANAVARLTPGMTKTDIQKAAKDIQGRYKEKAVQFAKLKASAHTNKALSHATKGATLLVMGWGVGAAPLTGGISIGVAAGTGLAGLAGVTIFNRRAASDEKKIDTLLNPPQPQPSQHRDSTRLS